MGKGFNNYMCKKFFHPASRDNLKRVWMAEQQTEAYKKKQEELRVQYEKEQDLYTNKAMMSTESKEKLSVNFLYEPPPGTKKDREREDDEPEFKFEWQRRFNAPRESYCKGDQEIRDQPFGIQVRNVRCIKCHKWGHINTDKECPMYNQSASGADGASSLNPSELIRQMREDGLAMKKGAVGLLELSNNPSNVSNHQIIPSSSEDEDHMNESELKFLEGLSTKKKMKLLKKLEKMEKKKKKKKKEKRKEGSKKKCNDSDSDDSDSPTVRKRFKNDVKNTSGDSQDDKTHLHHHYTGNKEVENDLYTVLGRKLDFEGPPKGHPKSLHGFRDGHMSKGRSRRYKSNCKSKSPPADRERYDHKIKEDPDRRCSHSTVDRDKSGPAVESRKKYEKASRREKCRRSRSRSRSRSPHQRENSRNKYR